MSSSNSVIIVSNRNLVQHIWDDPIHACGTPVVQGYADVGCVALLPENTTWVVFPG